jgi:O-antigen/teichoic acid export membrane protein
LSHPRKIALNTSQLSLCRVGGLIVQSIAFVIIARCLGKNGLGQYSVVFAYLSFFQIITGLSIDSLVIKELSNSDQHPAILGNAIILKILGGVVAVALSVLVLQFCGYDPEVKKYIYVASLSLLFGFSSIFSSLFQHHMKTLYYSLPEVVVALFSSVAMVISAVMGAPVLLLVIINSFSVVLMTVIYWILCVNKLHMRPIFVLDPVLSKKILLNAWPILFAAFFVAVNTRIDQVMLYRLRGDAEVGAYSAAVKLTEFLSFTPLAFSTVIFPFMCESYNSSLEKFVFVYRRSFKYMAILIVPVAFGTSILAEPIMNLVYGNKFYGSAATLAVLVWSQIFVFLGCINGNILIIMNLQKIMLYLTLTGAIANVLVNLWLIPLYSGLGAAIATVVSYGFVGGVFQMVLRDTRPIMLDYLGATIKPIIASIIMGIVIYNLLTLHFLIVIAIGMITYAAALIMIKGIDSVDLDYARQILNRRRDVIVIE